MKSGGTGRARALMGRPGMMRTASMEHGVLVRLVAGPVGVPLWLPLACTAVGAVIFARRYRYDPREEEAMAAIEDAIDQITRMTPPDDGDDPDGSSAR